VLISGAPGTAKTTLSGAFAQAACGRGERTLIVCFDSNLPEVIRNLASVGIQLNQHIENGILRMVSVRTITGSAEIYLGGIQALVKEHKANCLVIDPVTLSRTGNELTAHSVAVRLIDSLKAERTTLVCTSRIDELFGQTPDGCATLLSTLADTWIHLAYVDQAGLRARGLSIVKSRGTAHSNQLHTLTLGEAGISLCGSSAS
jgi:circadian clock protein KaiC